MSNSGVEWREFLKNHYPELIVMDGYDDCIVGVGDRFGQTFVVYDVGKVLEKLEKDGMSEEEAREWYEFNMVGAWVGDHTPCFVDIGL